MRMTARSFFLRTSLLAVGCLALTVSVRTMATPAAPQASKPSADSATLIARGEYLTTSVAMCVQCHSGRDENGTILDSARFHGGAIPVTSPYSSQTWATIAPSLAGLPGFTDDQVISLLTTGNMGDGRPSPRRPMPPFRMARPDAEAIVAFLRSR
jgi:mono/diheme cytochrome c family protein